jgi:hypothetical protein
MSVARLLDEMPSWEITYWLAYFGLKNKNKDQKKAMDKGVQTGAAINQRHMKKWLR